MQKTLLDLLCERGYRIIPPGDQVIPPGATEPIPTMRAIEALWAERLTPPSQ